MNQQVMFSADELASINDKFNNADPTEIVRWAIDYFGPLSGGIILTSSFGAESMCTIHLAQQVLPDIRVVFIDTGYLFEETIRFKQEMAQRFNLNIVEYRANHDPLTWLSINGEPDPAHRNNVEACCAANKNEPFDRAMRELAPAGWLRGVRADQSETRQNMHIVQWSKRNNCWAISPILRWNNRHVHAYMKQYGLPYHPLWEKGYTSIGCRPETCTRPVTMGDDTRSGRWAGLSKKECGLHLE